MSISDRTDFTRTSQVQLSCQKFQFQAAWAALPHPEKAWKGGQDAMFVSPNVLVVADGVSAWSKVGVDAGIYARRLVSEVKLMVQSPQELYFIEHPDEMALRAVQLVEERGSSTLSILTLHPQTGKMRSFYVGDSLFGIFKRNGQHVIAKEQQSTFDTPFQVYGGRLNIPPLKPIENYEPCDIFEGLYSEFGYNQLGGSSIVLASDGLWDNVHIQEIDQNLWMDEVDLRRKTGLLIEKVMHYCQLPTYASPYYAKGSAKGLKMEQKGKLDDVSIIVAEVVCFRE